MSTQTFVFHSRGRWSQAQTGRVASTRPFSSGRIRCTRLYWVSTRWICTRLYCTGTRCTGRNSSWTRRAITRFYARVFGQIEPVEGQNFHVVGSDTDILPTQQEPFEEPIAHEIRLKEETLRVRYIIHIITRVAVIFLCRYFWWQFGTA